MKTKFHSILGAILLLSSCNQVDAPQPHGPLPSESQIEWQEMEMYGFIHFSMNTFTDVEWGYGDKDPQLFNPTELDCRQWAKVSKEAGLTGLILTAKHHDGFCLWPSKTTDYSVASSPWKDGKGDLVRELSEACKEYGLKFGIYLSPWDRNYADYGKPEYITYMRKQLTELLTNYGDVFEVWFDGANGGDGYYGGARESRSVDRKTYYDWENTYKLVKELQPNAILWSDAGPGARWVGNEEGWAGETNWSTLRRDDVWPGFPDYKELIYGHEDGTHWVPAEVDVSIRPGWFYHESEDHKVRPLETMVDIYYNSIGRNSTFLLNFPVDRRGLIHEKDIERLDELTAVIKADFAVNLAEDADVEATNVRGGARKYNGAKTTDGDKNTYWATDDGVVKASLEIELGDEPVEFNRILIQEYIRLGQRVKNFSVEAFVEGQWKLLDEQTTIGYKRILRLPTTKATKVRLNILDSKAEPLITTVEIYNAPKLAIVPEIFRDKMGVVTIHNADKELEVRYTLDGSDPNAESLLYTEPFQTKGKTEIKAIVVDSSNGKGSSVASAKFDVLKANWKAVGETDEAVKYVFDGQSSTAWHKRAAKMPIELVVDLGEILTLEGFNYMPDQNRWAAGIVQNYTFSVSTNGRNWKQVSEGEFSNIRNNPVMQTKMFEPIQGRYVKLTAKANTDGTEIAGFAEFDVVTK